MNFGTTVVSLSLKQPTRALNLASEIALCETVFRLTPAYPATRRYQPANLANYQESYIVLRPRSSPASSNDIDCVSTLSAHEEFGISRRKLRELCKKGTVEAHKSGGKWVISRASLSKWLAQQT